MAKAAIAVGTAGGAERCRAPRLPWVHTTPGVDVTASDELSSSKARIYFYFGELAAVLSDASFAPTRGTDTPGGMGAGFIASTLVAASRGHEVGGVSHCCQ